MRLSTKISRYCFLLLLFHIQWQDGFGTCTLGYLGLQIRKLIIIYCHVLKLVAKKEPELDFPKYLSVIGVDPPRRGCLLCNRRKDVSSRVVRMIRGENRPAGGSIDPVDHLETSLTLNLGGDLRFPSGQESISAKPGSGSVSPGCRSMEKRCIRHAKKTNSSISARDWNGGRKMNTSFFGEKVGKASYLSRTDPPAHGEWHDPLVRAELSRIRVQEPLGLERARVAPIVLQVQRCYCMNKIWLKLLRFYSTYRVVHDVVEVRHDGRPFGYGVPAPLHLDVLGGKVREGEEDEPGEPQALVEDGAAVGERGPVGEERKSVAPHHFIQLPLRPPLSLGVVQKIEEGPGEGGGGGVHAGHEQVDQDVEDREIAEAQV